MRKTKRNIARKTKADRSNRFPYAARETEPSLQRGDTITIPNLPNYTSLPEATANSARAKQRA